MDTKDRKKEKESEIINAGIAGAAAETVQRYGEANKQHLVAYSGIDNGKIDKTTGQGQRLKKSLKSVKAQKTNEKNAYSIQKQKEGWVAEIKDTANTNAERIISGNPKRKIRHDDLPNTPANHPLYDHVETDSQGNVISKSGSQMKFKGASHSDAAGVDNAKRALKELKKRENWKYVENDVPIEVPKDEYAQMIEIASEEIINLQKQLEKVRETGNQEAIARLEAKIEYLRKLQKLLKPSTVTRAEAVEAAAHPKLSTAKSIAKISHRAGIKTAKQAALLSASTSMIRNVVEVCKGEIDIKEATKDVAETTGKSAVVGYATGFVGSTIESTMQNSASKYVRDISKTNLAGTIVSVTVDVSKTLKKYFAGDIDGTECMEILGEQGTGMVASSMFAVIGQAAIPIPIVGAAIGSMVGYALTSATYGILMESLKEAKFAKAERMEVESACEEHINMLRQYRLELEEFANSYLLDSIDQFNNTFSEIKRSLSIGDVDQVILNSNMITEAFGGQKPFEDMDDFREKILNGKTIIL